MPNRIPTFNRDRTHRRRLSARRERYGAERDIHNRRWERLRRWFLVMNPLCWDCRDSGRTKPAVEVHHIKKRSESPELVMETANLMPLCKRCHSARTTRGE